MLGLGVEHRFLQHIVAELSRSGMPISARIIETARNAPVRNIYRDNGFSRDSDRLWRFAATTEVAA